MKSHSRLLTTARISTSALLALGMAVLVLAVDGADSAPPTAPVALVILIEGDVQLGRSSLPLHHMATPMETVALANNSKAALLYPQEARLWTLYGPGKARITAKAPVALDKRLRIESRLLPALYREVEVGSAGIAQGALVLRSSTPIRISGARTGLWFEPRGELQWTAPASAQRFDVEVIRADGAVVQKHSTTETRINIIDLVPGSAYIVRVQGTDASGRSYSDSVRFSVLEEQRARDLAAAQPAADAETQVRAAYDALLAAIAAAPWR